jgi:hypothetical protein
VKVALGPDPVAIDPELKDDVITKIIKKINVKIELKNVQPYHDTTCRTS